MEGALGSAALRPAGWGLVLGGILAVVGAFWPPYRQWYAPLEDGLRVIASHPVGWRMIHGGFLAGTWATTLGLGLLAFGLRGRSGFGIAALGAVVFAIASLCWTLNIVSRLTDTVAAARAFVDTGTWPASFESARVRAGRLFAAFAALSYLTVALSGWNILRTGIADAWLGWALVGWGLSGGLIVGINVPVMIYFPTLALGIALLRG